MKDDKIKEIFTNYTYILIDKREKKLHIKETYDELIHDADSIGWNIPEGTVVPEKPAAKVSRRKKNA